MNYLITGGCGFLGSNLACEIIQRGEELTIFDNLYRFGSEKNLAWLREQGNFKFVHGDIRNREDIERTIISMKPDVIFHLAGQVAMTTSIESPRMDFEINALGSLNVLEAVRKYSHESIIMYSSTNKVYGDLEHLKYDELDTRYKLVDYPDGLTEETTLDFHSPYGCSKGAADQYMLDYYRIFGIRTVVFRHSSMFGTRQFATYDQGWIGWFCQKAIETRNNTLKEPFTISGNGKQVRDVLFADDMIGLYFKTIENIANAKGTAFNIGGGMINSLSLLELFDILEKELDVKLKYTKLSPRESDQKVFVANIKKAIDCMNWKPNIDKITGIRRMINWIKEYAK
jgi:CDP-paratose 2-epimerase